MGADICGEDGEFDGVQVRVSWKASAYVKELIRAPNGDRITRSEKLLLLVIADSYNDDESGARPSIHTLAEQTLLSARRVRELQRSSERKGVLSIASRQRSDGGSMQNFYSLPGLRNSQGEAANPRRGGLREIAGGGCESSPSLYKAEQEVEQVVGSRTRARSPSSIDSDYLKSLKQNPAYVLIDVERVNGKMIAWCELHGKQPTRRRLLNWLNREDVPMQSNGKRERPLVI